MPVLSYDNVFYINLNVAISVFFCKMSTNTNTFKNISNTNTNTLMFLYHFSYDLLFGLTYNM